MLEEFISNLHPVLAIFVRIICFSGIAIMFVPIQVWWERRLLGWMQDRVGPNRVGPFGLLQPVADAIKLFLKEDHVPSGVDKFIYYLAPILAFLPAFALGGTMPWAPAEGLYGLLTPVADINIGVLYVLAISSLGSYGVVLAGYAGNNKYSLLGGLRASAQLISYELAMTVSLAAIILVTGSLRMSEVVSYQTGPLWGIFPYIQNWNLLTPTGLVAGVIFFICAIAETNRAPFDLPEAESELIGGYHTEYSSFKFGLFFLSEYAARFVFSGVFATIFLGGYNMLPVRWDILAVDFPGWSEWFYFMHSANYWLSPVAFIAKCFLGFTVFVWVRATLPRLRYDQLMSIGWKSLLPAAVANFIVVAVWIMVTNLYGMIAGYASLVVSAIILLVLYLNIKAVGFNESTSTKRRIKMAKFNLKENEESN